MKPFDMYEITVQGLYLGDTPPSAGAMQGQERTEQRKVIIYQQIKEKLNVDAVVAASNNFKMVKK